MSYIQNRPEPGELTHLSASHVNHFISRRPLWFLERVKGYKFPMGPVVHRGAAVEIGAVTTLISGDIETSTEKALETYDEKCADLDVDDTEEARKPIPELINVTADFLAELTETHGKIVKTQGRVEIALPGWQEMKWLGYTDVEFEDGLVLDIKTAGRTPSSLKDDWRRQGTIYHHARQAPVMFACAVPLKTGAKIKQFDLTEEDYERGTRELVTYGKALEWAMLTADKSYLSTLLMPSTDDWALNDAMVASAAREVWGI